MVEQDIDDLEAEIKTLAAHRYAADCRWLLLVGEFDRRKGFERWECRSTAHWLNWHCGLNLQAARKQVRVARALEALPLVRDAFAAGRISYSKVRAITRVATPATESLLLEWAAHGTASQLERIVGGRRAVTRREAQELKAASHVSFLFDDDGTLVVRGRLTPEDGAAFVAALTRAREALEPEDVEEKGAPAGARATNADALTLITETFLGADTAAPLSRHERTLVMVHANADVGEGHLHDGPNLSTETLRRIACDAPACLIRRGSERLDLGRTVRQPTRAQKRALMARDGGCRFPGCGERRYVDAHHVWHWSDGGPTDVDNLVLLCWRHHHALHEGGWSMAFEAGAVTVWRPDGTLLATEALVVPEGPGVVEQNEELGLAIDDETCAAEWDTDNPQYHWAVEGLLHLEDRHKREVEAKEQPRPDEDLRDTG